MSRMIYYAVTWMRVTLAWLPPTAPVFNVMLLPPTKRTVKLIWALAVSVRITPTQLPPIAPGNSTVYP